MEEARLFEDAGVNGALVRKLSKDILQEVGINGNIRQAKYLAFSEEIDSQESAEDHIEKNAMRNVLVALFLPPLSVYLSHGVGWPLLLNTILTFCAGLPGAAHAIYLVYN